MGSFHPITQSIPIILLSAGAGEEATVEGLEARADDYLIKPSSATSRLLSFVSQAVMNTLEFIDLFYPMMYNRR